MQTDIQLLTFQECKDMLRVGATTLYGLLQAGEIEHYKTGGRYLIPIKAVYDYLNRHRD